jgi:hypothetical protein
MVSEKPFPTNLVEQNLFLMAKFERMDEERRLEKENMATMGEQMARMGEQMARMGEQMASEREEMAKINAELAVTLRWSSGPCIVSFLESRLKREMSIKKDDRTPFRKLLAEWSQAKLYNISKAVWIAIWDKFSWVRNEAVHYDGPTNIAARSAFEKESEVVNSMTEDMRHAIQVLLNLDE